MNYYAFDLNLDTLNLVLKLRYGQDASVCPQSSSWLPWFKCCGFNRQTHRQPVHYSLLCAFALLSFSKGVSTISWIVLVLVIRELCDESVNLPHVSSRYQPALTDGNKDVYNNFWHHNTLVVLNCSVFFVGNCCLWAKYMKIRQSQDWRSPNFYIVIKSNIDLLISRFWCLLASILTFFTALPLRWHEDLHIRQNRI